jgi:hypothetical protein
MFDSVLELATGRKADPTLTHSHKTNRGDQKKDFSRAD